MKKQNGKLVYQTKEGHTMHSLLYILKQCTAILFLFILVSNCHASTCAKKSLQECIDAFIDPIYVMMDQHVVAINKAYQEQIGYTIAELNRHLAVKKDDLDPTLEIIVRSAVYECSLQNKDR